MMHAASGAKGLSEPNHHQTNAQPNSNVVYGLTITNRYSKRYS